MGACVSVPVGLGERVSSVSTIKTQMSLTSELIKTESEEYFVSTGGELSPQQKIQMLSSLLDDKTSPPSPCSPHDQVIPFAKKVTYRELQVATQNFSSEYILGAGSFGNVYRGVMLNLSIDPPENVSPGSSPSSCGAVQVAVKELSEDSRQGYREYLSEVKVLNRVRHPNLVRLLAHCHEDGRALLAYELCPKGPLDKVLQKGISDGKPLAWKLRVRVAIGVARGLQCLHDNNVIHRDLKSSNVLLMKDYSAKVADFGLARKGPTAGQTHVSTKIMGTAGYLDPGYMASGRLTKKSDTYAFGVMLLELVTGRPSMYGTMTLISWMSQYLGQKRPEVERFVDPRLGDDYEKVEVVKMIILAKHCLQEDRLKRPEIQAVVSALDRNFSEDSGNK